MNKTAKFQDNLKKTFWDILLTDLHISGPKKYGRGPAGRTLKLFFIFFEVYGPMWPYESKMEVRKSKFEGKGRDGGYHLKHSMRNIIVWEAKIATKHTI